MALASMEEDILNSSRFVSLATLSSRLVSFRTHTVSFPGELTETSASSLSKYNQGGYQQQQGYNQGYNGGYQQNPNQGRSGGGGMGMGGVALAGVGGLVGGALLMNGESFDPLPKILDHLEASRRVVQVLIPFAFISSSCLLAFGTYFYTVIEPT